MSLSAAILSRYRTQRTEDWLLDLVPLRTRKPTIYELYHTVPVDIEQIAFLAGVRIFRRPLPDKTAAILHRVDRETWYLYLNASHCIERQRFTIGHELSHVYQTRYIWPPKPPELDRKKARQWEKHADSSAADFLMPKWYVRVWLGDGLSIKEMAKRFIVSEEALRIQVSKVLSADRKCANYLSM